MPGGVPAADRLWRFWRRRKWPGFHRAWRACRGPEGRLHCATRYGSVFALDPYGYIDHMVLTSGFYESEVIEALRGELRPGAVLWDIGANFGLVAVTAARLEGAAQVVAFEPNRTEFRRLARHAAMNRCRIGLANCALSDVSGKMAFQPGPAQNSGMGRLGNDPDPRFGFQEQVPVATGDGLIQDGLQPAPTVVKIDVEGHELRALQGMAHALAHPRCRLVVFEDARDTASPVQALLRELGFEISPLERREATHHPLENLAARKR